MGSIPRTRVVSYGILNDASDPSSSLSLRLRCVYYFFYENVFPRLCFIRTPDAYIQSPSLFEGLELQFEASEYTSIILKCLSFVMHLPVGYL